MTRLVLGIDEGTTAVKAALFDADLRLVREARRDKATSQPRPGWVEQDPEAVLAAVVDAVAELLDDAPGEIVACGLDHQGESVLGWDAETGRALTPIVVWQDKRSQSVLDRLASDSDAIHSRSGLPLDPYFSAGKLAWLLEHDAAVRRAQEAGTLRLGTVDAFLTDRLGDVFATDASTASRTQLQALGGDGFDADLARRFGVPLAALPNVGDSAGELGTLRHERWPVELPLRGRAVDQQAALAGAGCVVPGRTKATYGTGVFVLAHAGDTPPRAAHGLLPTVAWRIAGRTEYALEGGVFTAGAMLEWLCSTLHVAATPRELGALARTVDDTAGVRVLPALAGLGAPWWRPDAHAVLAGLRGATTAGHVARAALEGIAWRVADIVAAVAETAPVDVLRVDGGLSNEPLLLELQADALDTPIQTGAVDATVTGAAALAAVGAGLLPSLQDAAERLPAGRRVEPRAPAARRAEAHAAWREFVRGAATLGG